jgi:hypothetical protein
MSIIWPFIKAVSCLKKSFDILFLTGMLCNHFPVFHFI